MSVMQCDRGNCDNVMCEHCILNGTKYICNYCLSELREWKETWPKEMTALEVRHKIEEFMRSNVGDYKPKEELDEDGIEKEFNRLLGL